MTHINAYNIRKMNLEEFMDFFNKETDYENIMKIFKITLKIKNVNFTEYIIKNKKDSINLYINDFIFYIINNRQTRLISYCLKYIERENIFGYIFNTQAYITTEDLEMIYNNGFHLPTVKTNTMIYTGFTSLKYEFIKYMADNDDNFTDFIKQNISFLKDNFEFSNKVFNLLNI